MVIYSSLFADKPGLLTAHFLYQQLAGPEKPTVRVQSLLLLLAAGALIAPSDRFSCLVILARASVFATETTKSMLSPVERRRINTDP